MKTYLENKDLTLTIALVDGAGAVFAAVTAQYRVLSASGAVLVAQTAVPAFVAGSTATITILAAMNLVPAGETRTAQSIELFLTNAGGSLVQTESYGLEKSEVLEVPTNSFQTLAGAEATAMNIPALDGWLAASSPMKVQALIEARHHLVRLRYRTERSDPTQSLVDPSFAASDFNLITLAEWNVLPVEFRTALQRAQVAEANYLLSGGSTRDELRQLREDGLMSMTVGESSQMFRPGKPLKFAVCREAIDYIEKFLSWRRQLTRS